MEKEKIKVIKKRTKIINDNVIDTGNVQISGEDLTDNLYQSLGQYFNDGKITNQSHIAKLIANDMKAIEKRAENPETALSVLRSLMSISNETSRYYMGKKQQDKDYTEFLIYRTLFDWQKEVYNANSKRIALLCGRRSGKSYLIGDLMLKHCAEGYDNIIDEKTGMTFKKPRQAVYVGLTVEKAAAIMWEQLKKQVESFHMPVSRIDNGKYTIQFSNGSSIALVGNNSKAEREKLRGLDASMWCIDEMQSQQGIAYLIESIIQPIISGRNGTLVCAGTAPITACSYWENINKSDLWYKKHATLKDNPSIPDCEHELDNVLAANKWSADNITFRREYLGEVAYDSDRQIYPVRSYYTDVPKQKVKSIWVGLDFGWTDKSAWAPVIELENGECYLAHEFKQNRMASSAIIDKTNELVEFLSKTYNMPYNQVHVRCDNNEQNIVRDIQNLYPKMDIHCANKKGEDAQIALVKDMLESKQLLIQKGNAFDDECDKLVWQYDNERQEVLYGQIDDKTYHGDICDAVKYAISSYFGDKSFRS